MSTLTARIYGQLIAVEHDRESWCPECLLSSVLKVTYGVSFKPEAFVPSMVGSVRFCHDCGREIE